MAKLPVNYRKMSDEITAQELKKRIDNNEDFVLVDVREQFERDISKIEPSLFIPIDNFMDGNIGELEHIGKDKDIVVYCHQGGRSQMACEVLKSKGYHNAKNLLKGIDGWAKEIDKNIAVY